MKQEFDLSKLDREKLQHLVLHLDGTLDAILAFNNTLLSKIAAIDDVPDAVVREVRTWSTIINHTMADAGHTVRLTLGQDNAPPLN